MTEETLKAALAEVRPALDQMDTSLKVLLEEIRTTVKPIRELVNKIDGEVQDVITKKPEKTNKAKVKNEVVVPPEPA